MSKGFELCEFQSKSPANLLLDGTFKVSSSDIIEGIFLKENFIILENVIDNMKIVLQGPWRIHRHDNGEEIV